MSPTDHDSPAATAASGRGRYFERMAADRDWDAAVNTFETARRLQLVFERLLAPLDLEGLRLLDAGSGGGHFSAVAAARGAEVYSLDIGPNLLRQVVHRCMGEGRGTRAIIGSVIGIPVREGAFDVVLCTEVIEHTPDPLSALGELMRAVSPGGHLVLTTPGRLWQPVVRGATRLGLRPYEGYENFIWPTAARRVLEGSGFLVEELFGFNLLPLFSPRYEALQQLADRLGHVAPVLYVNFGLRARRRPD